MARYRCDLSRLTMRECWHFSPNVPTFGLMLGCKLLRINLGGNQPRACSIENLVPVEPEEFPPEVYRALEQLMTEVVALGLELRLLYTVPSVEGVGYAAAFTAPDGLTLAEVMYSRVEDTTVVVGMALSRVDRDRELITINTKRTFDPHPEAEVEYLPDAEFEGLLRRHRQRQEGRQLQLLPSALDELQHYILCRQQEFIRRMIERRIYLPVEGYDEDY